MATTKHTVTCRKAFTCHDIHCGKRVQVGEEYARFVAFPWDDEVNQSPTIWVFKACRDCATRYGQPMPPRRTQKAGEQR